jgi:DNA-binding IclR family transcriptional regulator
MGLARYTPKSVTDGKLFFKDVLEVKEKGYAVDDEGYLLGVRAIAAPIPVPSFPPAAIWVVGFTSTLDDRKLKSVTLEIPRTAQEITQTLHHHVS